MRLVGLLVENPESLFGGLHSVGLWSWGVKNFFDCRHEIPPYKTYIAWGCIVYSFGTAVKDFKWVYSIKQIN